MKINSSLKKSKPKPEKPKQTNKKPPQTHSHRKLSQVKTERR